MWVSGRDGRRVRQGAGRARRLGRAGRGAGDGVAGRLARRVGRVVRDAVRGRRGGLAAVGGRSARDEARAPKVMELVDEPEEVPVPASVDGRHGDAVPARLRALFAATPTSPSL